MSSLALAAVIVNVAIVFTGGLVRVTGSGLGCPDWPTCTGDRVVPSASDATWHTAIEFGNRLMTFLVLAVVVWLFVAARRRSEDLRVRRLALLLPLGVLAQAVLGGVTVLTGLHPLIVAAHFLLSMVLIAIAVLLHLRVSADRPVTGTASTTRVRVLALATVTAAAAVLVLGTLVTASGPHAGDPGTVRLGLDIRTIARVHAGAVWAVTLLTAATYLVARREQSSRVQRAAGVLLAVEVIQGTVGYTQYALDIPAALVAVHILLASLFWVAAVRLVGIAVGWDISSGSGDRAPARVGA
ncbi:MAG: COX15/CtaA family protein [Nitriliruptorales bacterium]|nr:COX15/CtaA family protein [Nitriliruptorales bacterium]